eukprot:422299_1
MKLSFCTATLFLYTTLHFIITISNSAALQSEQSTCTSQSQCLTTDIQQIISHDSIQYDICLIYNTTLPNCQSHTPIDYTCTSPTSTIKHALKSNEKICHSVKCNEQATFAIKDGQGCQLNSDLTNITLNTITGISCNYPFNGINYCKGKSNAAKKECIWTIPAPKCSTLTPNISPTEIPTKTPSFNPTKTPSDLPTYYPSHFPTNIPSNNPSKNPTSVPSKNPTPNPTVNPSATPTNNPSIFPTKIPSFNPSINPSYYPTKNP